MKLNNDMAFQQFFGRPKMSNVTAHLVSLILQRSVKNINLDLNKRMYGDDELSKTERLDIRARFNGGEEANVEFQVNEYPYMEKRMLDYWSNMYSNRIKRGERYSELKPTVSILITLYEVEKLKDIKKFHTKWNLREAEYKDKIITDNIELHILEMPKVKRTETEEKELALWMKFIQNTSDEEVRREMEKTRNNYYEQAVKELEYMKSDPNFQRWVDARAGGLRDQEAFKDWGIEKRKKRTEWRNGKKERNGETEEKKNKKR